MILGDDDRDPNRVLIVERRAEIVIYTLPACNAPRIIHAPRRALGRIRFTPDGRGLAFKDPTNINLMAQPFAGRQHTR